MTQTIALPAEQPLSELNTTPLIDVLLVLLILFVITVPAATHSLDVSLPSEPGFEVNRDRNMVVVTGSGAVLWNGSAVTQPELAGLLQVARKLPVEPELQFEPEANAQYALAAETIRTIKLSGVTAFGFVGNERFSEFGKAPR
jgi:biopolymer transport protein ExbD